MKTVELYVVKVGDAVLAAKRPDGSIVPHTFPNKKFAEGVASGISLDFPIEQRESVSIGTLSFILKG